MTRWSPAAALIAAFVPACGAADEPCDVRTEACTLEHDFGAVTAAPHAEVDGICLSWTIGNTDDLWVNSVAADNDGYFHHSNWVWVPDNRWELPDGAWDCAENQFNELAAAVFGGVLFAQSTQSVAEEQRFADGAAVRVPPYARIIAYSHILNAGDAEVSTNMRVALGTIPPDRVAVQLAPFRFNYSDLDIPAMATAEHTGDCELAGPLERATGAPFRLDLYYLLPHYHVLGSGFRVEYSGGPRDGDTVVDLEGAYAEPLGQSFDPPIDVAAAGATGLRFTCEHVNPRGKDVGYGIGDQEMCVALGFADSGAKFDAAVDETTDASARADGTFTRGGRCTVAGVRLE